ncbi:MAG TPA: PqqD family protein [Solirubrobacteraceae bacterium]|nr:PqqD family protein [Solirubrobacteraceae bacterium]
MLATRPAVVLGTRFRVRERVLSRQLGEETVLLDLDSGHYFDLDETGGRIWAALVAEESPESLVEMLAGEFDAPREVIARDVAGLLGELERAGLVVREG